MKEIARTVNWKSVWGAIAVAAGILALDSAVAAVPVPATSAGFKLAQVGVRNRINPPTPLNLRPQTHIPLPTSSRSRDYNSSYGSYGRYPHHGEYGYGHGHHHDCHHCHDRSKRRRRRPVIIINPASSSYSNYRSQNSYIRIIRE